jgi:hypothetical protein
VANVGTSKAGGKIIQQAAVHPWLAADAQGNKQTSSMRKQHSLHTLPINNTPYLTKVKGKGKYNPL